MYTVRNVGCICQISKFQDINVVLHKQNKGYRKNTNKNTYLYI